MRGWIWRRRGSREQKRTASWRQRTQRGSAWAWEVNTPHTTSCCVQRTTARKALIAPAGFPLTAQFWRRVNVVGFTFHLPAHWPSLSGGLHFCRDVLPVTMEFSCPPAASTLLVPLRRSSPPSTADWFPAAGLGHRRAGGRIWSQRSR